MTWSNDPPATGGYENYYDILGLKPGASDDDIEAAYTDLSAMFAPAGIPAARLDYARKQRARLAAAYAVLADPERRTAYDSGRGSAVATPPPLETATEPSMEQPNPPVEAATAPSPPADTVYQAALRTVRGDPLPDVPLPAPVPEVMEPAVIASPEPVATQVFTPAPSAPEPVAAPVITPEPAATEPGGAQTAGPLSYAAGETRNASDAPDAAVADPALMRATDVAVADVALIRETSAAVATELIGATDAATPDAPPAETPPWEAAAVAADAQASDGDDTADDGDESDELPPISRRPAAVTVIAPLTRAADSGRARVEPARLVAPAVRPVAPRGSVILPTRREAAQITARQPTAPALPLPAPPRNTGVAPRPQAGDRPATRPQSRPQPVYEDDELADVRGSRPLRAVAPPRRKRRRADSNRLIYQVLTLIIGLVLVISTVASVYTNIATTSGTAGTRVISTSVPPTTAVSGLISNGASFEQKKQYQFAEQFYLQALQTEPQSLAAMIGLARVYRDKQPPEFAKAQQYAQQIVQIGASSPQAAEAFIILAQVSLTSTAGVAPAGSPAAAGTPAPTSAAPVAGTPAP